MPVETETEKEWVKVTENGVTMYMTFEEAYKFYLNHPKRKTKRFNKNKSRKTEQISVRITQEQMNVLRGHAKDDNIRFSEYIRQLVLGECR